MNVKLIQSGQDMSLTVVIEFGGNPGSNKKILQINLFWYFWSLIVNVPLCHEDGGEELCKLNILIVVS